MSKKSVLTIRVPDELKRRIERLAENQGVSINQFALYAFTKEIGELETNEYFRRFLGGMDKKQILSDFDIVMDKVTERDIPSWDRVD